MPPPQVWFLGKADASKVRGNPHLGKTNCGYDDERGDYHVVMHDHIAYRWVDGAARGGLALCVLAGYSYMRAGRSGWGGGMVC